MRSVSATRPPKVIPSVSISVDETDRGAVLVCIGWLYQRMLFPQRDYAISSAQCRGSDMDKRVKSYGVVTPEVLKSYDGLGFLKAIIDGTVPNPPISELMGFHLTEVEQGRAVFEGLPEFHHYNPIGTVHGGFAATLLDSALGCAIFSTIEKGDGWTTLELKFNLVRPLTKDTGPVRAEGRVVHRGRTVATSEGDLKDRAGTLYAHATTTCMIFPAKG
jgi:uncharacterized protein (TIGR00369 family)